MDIIYIVKCWYEIREIEFRYVLTHIQHCLRLKAYTCLVYRLPL
jgi:hypothetical protein